MGTRGAVGFKVDDKYFVTYNHYDSYPDGLGVEVVDFCYKVEDWDQLKENIRKIELVKEDDCPTKEQIKECKKSTNLNVGDQSTTDWYCLLRGAQGVEGFEAIYNSGLKYMIDNFEFLKDSLFCEYAYIINLDTMKLEFYQGFNKSVDENSPLPFEQVGDKSGYYPVRFKGSCSLNDIPDDWIKKFYPEEE